MRRCTAVARRRFRLAVVATTLLSLGSTGCTASGRENGATPGVAGSSHAIAAPSLSATEYRYTRGGVSASLRYRPGEATLEVKNHSGEELAAPGLYLLRADDGRRVNGRMSGAAPIPDGVTSTTRASFAPSLAAEDVGIIVLLIGSDNYGAFLPPTG